MVPKIYRDLPALEDCNKKAVMYGERGSVMGHVKRMPVNIKFSVLVPLVTRIGLETQAWKLQSYFTCHMKEQPID